MNLINYFIILNEDKLEKIWSGLTHEKFNVLQCYKFVDFSILLSFTQEILHTSLKSMILKMNQIKNFICNFNQLNI